MNLTTDQVRALHRVPFKGLEPLSHHWPLIEIHGPPEAPGRICDGTDVPALLSMGLLSAEPLDEPWPVGEHPTAGPVAATHRYRRTRAGDRALRAFVAAARGRA